MTTMYVHFYPLFREIVHSDGNYNILKKNECLLKYVYWSSTLALSIYFLVALEALIHCLHNFLRKLALPLSVNPAPYNTQNNRLLWSLFVSQLHHQFPICAKLLVIEFILNLCPKFGAKGYSLLDELGCSIREVAKKLQEVREGTQTGVQFEDEKWIVDLVPRICWIVESGIGFLIVFFVFQSFVHGWSQFGINVSGYVRGVVLVLLLR